MVIIALTYYTFKRQENLLDDELLQQALSELEQTREKLKDWIEENEPRTSCAVCGRTNLRYEWDRRVCNDCGAYEDIDVPHKGKAKVPRKLFAIMKTVFGRRLAQAKNEETMSESDLKHVPIELDNFDTGEYTKEQVKYLNTRFKEILETSDIEFSKKDLANIHFLILQELKIKGLYRKEAIKGGSKVDKEFTNVKHKELKIYNDLKDDINEIIENKKTSETELAVYDKVRAELKDKDMSDLVEEFEQRREQRQEKISESEERREKIKEGLIDPEEKIEELEEEIENGS